MHQENEKKRVLIIGKSDLDEEKLYADAGCSVEHVESLQEAAVKHGAAIFDEIVIASEAGDLQDICTQAQASSLYSSYEYVGRQSQLIQDFFQSAPAGMAIFDAVPPYKVIIHNRVYQEMWAEPFRSQGMVGKYIADYAPLAHKSIFQVFREVAESKIPKTIYEFPYDGMERGRTWWNWNLSPILRDGEVVAFAHMLIEVTDQVLARMQVEDYASEAEEGRRTLDALMEHVPEGITIAGGPPDFKIKLVSKHGLEMLGISLEAIEDLRAGKYNGKFGFYLPDGVTRTSPEKWLLYRATRLGEVTTNEEIVFERPDGVRVPLLLNSAPIRDSEDNIAGGIVTWRDITHLKRAEAEVARARDEAESRAAELESFIASIADGVVLFDAHGKVTYMNDAARDILGIPADVSPNVWATDYERFSVDGTPLEHDQWAVNRALHGDIATDVRYKVISLWGKEIFLNVSSSPVRDNRGRIIGATNIFRDQSERVAIEREREELYRRERRIAEMLQQALVPPTVPREIGSYKVAVTYQPALKEAEIGGDFYDVFEIGDDRFGILIGDVAGKGLLAAIRVAAARYSIRSYALVDPRPSRVLTLANQSLCRGETDTASMLTAFFAVLDARLGTITYASAGHKSPWVLDADGNVSELETYGLALGIVCDATYTEERQRLNPGDTIVMVTDGVTESRAAGAVLFGEEGVTEYLLNHPGAAPDHITAGLLEAANQHAGGHVQDDIAIVVVKFDGAGAQKKVRRK